MIALSRAVLLDTSFVLAYASTRDINHNRARIAMQRIRGTRVIPAPLLTELFYMVRQHVNYSAAVALCRELRAAPFEITDLSVDDMQRMDAIMTQYLASRFDYVDVAIMALAERLRIADIYTFDQRDFSQFRPAHRPYLRLLP
jgi:predicted nucleic acid-binding protein